MAVTGFVFGMVLLCVLGVGLAAAGIIWLVVQRKSHKAKESKGRLVLPILPVSYTHLTLPTTPYV